MILSGRVAHNGQIAATTLPVVNVGNREHPKYLPAEVCTTLTWQNSRSKNGPKQTMELINFAFVRHGRMHTFSTTTVSMPLVFLRRAIQFW